MSITIRHTVRYICSLSGWGITDGDLCLRAHARIPPIPRTRLIGREGDRAAAPSHLLDQMVPLLTLTGPGGVGKTRLALAVAGDAAAHFADGVVWVDLAPRKDTTTMVRPTDHISAGSDRRTHALAARSLLRAPSRPSRPAAPSPVSDASQESDQRHDDVDRRTDLLESASVVHGYLVPRPSTGRE